MAVFRVERTRDYTVMCNHHLKDSNLSLKAKGLLSMMLSLPDEWNYTTRGLAAICKEGVDAIGKTLKELELAGYIIRRQLRGKDGRISDTEYTIFEKPRKPSPPDTTLPDTENPYLDNPDTEAPDTDNPAQLNTKKSNTQKSNTDLSSTHSFFLPAADGMTDGFEKKAEIRDQQVKPWKNCKQRTMNNTVELLIPLKDKVEKYLFNKGAVKQRTENGKLEPEARVDLTRNTDLEIVTTYDAEIRGLCNFYFLASNYRSLNYFSYLIEYSCLKTLAWKHRCKLSKIYDKYRIGAKRWGIPYETKTGRKVRKLTKFNEIDGKRCDDVIPAIITIIAKGRTTIDSRLKAYRCELCGYEGKDRKYEVHHVNKVKNLKGKEPWEVVMIAKRRKTLVVCRDCHQKIHHGF